MDDALPRLPAADCATGINPSTSRRAKALRSSLPKSAGPNSPKRRNRSGLHSALVRSTEEKPPGEVSIVVAQRRAVHRHTASRSSPRPNLQNPNQVAFGDRVRDNEAALSAVENENQQLRQQITLLQQKLVEKMRGTGKVLVGGGQFRAPHAMSSPIRPGSIPTTAQSCGGCLALRASLKKAYDVSDQEQRTLSSRILELEQGENEAHTSLNQREEEIVRLQKNLRQIEATAAAMKAQLGLQTDELHALNQELMAEKRRESQSREVEAIRAEPTVGIVNKAAVSTQTGEDGINDEARVHNLVRQLQHINADLSRQCERLRNDNTKCKDEHAKEIKQAEQDRLELADRITEVENDLLVSAKEKKMLVDKLNELEESIADVQHLLVVERETSTAEEAKWRNQIAKKEKDIFEQNVRLRECENLLTGWKERMFEFETHSQAQKENADNEAMRFRAVLDDKIASIESLQAQLQATTQERDEAMKTVSDLHYQLDVMQRNLEAARAEILKSQLLYEETSNQLVAIEAEAVAREEVFTRLKKAHSSALEKAVQSAVRLCVVAPTVNVHLDSTTGVVACKPALPEDQLRSVIEQDVLPMFTTVFIQSQESTSPTGEPMDAWLQNLLRVMQESLATHLRKVYSATTVS